MSLLFVVNLTNFIQPPLWCWWRGPVTEWRPCLSNSSGEMMLPLTLFHMIAILEVKVLSRWSQLMSIVSSTKVFLHSLFIKGVLQCERCTSPNIAMPGITPGATGFPEWSKVGILVLAPWWHKAVFTLIFFIFTRCVITAGVVRISTYSMAVDHPRWMEVWQKMFTVLPCIHIHSFFPMSTALQWC